MVSDLYTILAIGVSGFLVLVLCMRSVVRTGLRALPWGEQPITLLFVYHSRPSSRINVLLAGLYFSVNLIFICQAMSVEEAAAKRAAILGLANLIPTYTFAKMNPAIDGIGFTRDSLSILHQWLAFISFSQIYFHGLYLTLKRGLTSTFLTALLVLLTVMGLGLITLQLPSLTHRPLSWVSSIFHGLHIICAIAILPMIAVHIGWPYIIGPAAGWLGSRLLSWIWTGYLAYHRPSIGLSSNTGGTFQQLTLQLRRPRAFIPGQYFLYDPTRWAFLCYLGLRAPRKFYISEVIARRQRNYPVFEVPQWVARGITMGIKPYIEGPYGGLDVSVFTRSSKFIVLVAEDIGLGRQLFLLREIIEQHTTRSLKIFLIWIINHPRYDKQILDLYGWSMKKKEHNIEELVRSKKRISLFIKIYGTTQTFETNILNTNIFMQSEQTRFKGNIMPDIKGGVTWGQRNQNGLKDEDFALASISICGSSRTIAGFQVLRNKEKPLHNLQALDTAVLGY